jgi:XTP/dITP diphosphohydrolase
MATLVLATDNQHKVREIRHILVDQSIDLKTARELGVENVLREDGDTFEANALQKAREVYGATGLPTLADDSGLEVFFLNHRPGVRSARYAGENATDEQNNKKLLGELGALSFRRRTARFRSVIAFVADDMEETVSGECRGTVIEHPRGVNGFGYDPLFIPDGYKRTYAELSDEEKHAISHRARSLARIKPILQNYFAAAPHMQKQNQR